MANRAAVNLSCLEEGKPDPELSSSTSASRGGRRAELQGAPVQGGPGRLADLITKPGSRRTSNCFHLVARGVNPRKG